MLECNEREDTLEAYRITISDAEARLICLGFHTLYFHLFRKEIRDPVVFLKTNRCFISTYVNTGTLRVSRRDANPYYHVGVIQYFS